MLEGPRLVCPRGGLVGTRGNGGGKGVTPKGWAPRWWAPGGLASGGCPSGGEG